MSTARIKTGDIVVVITGRGGDSEKAFKGKTGKVLAVNAKRGVAIVESLANLKQIVDERVTVFILALPMEEMPASPVRVVAIRG